MTTVGAKQLEEIQNKQDSGVKVCSAEVTDSPLGKTVFISNKTSYVYVALALEIKLIHIIWLY